MENNERSERSNYNLGDVNEDKEAGSIGIVYHDTTRRYIDIQITITTK